MRRGVTGAVVGSAIAIALSASACSSDMPADRTPPFHPEKPAAPFISRQICSLLDENGNGAQILGQDGGTTNVVDGTVYWTFGDTLTTDNPFTPNNIATSTDFDAEDCITLDHKRDAAGAAAVLLPRQGDEITVWAAAGQVSVEPDAVHFLYNSVIDADNAAGWHHVQGVGLAKFDRATLQSERVIDLLIEEQQMPGDGITSTSGTDMLIHDGYVYIYLTVDWNARVGRVPIAQIEDKAAYRYWDGNDWAADSGASVDILRTAGGQQAFNVDFSPYLGKWTAIYSTNTLSATAIAYADAPEGPFIDETLLFDCRDIQAPRRFDPVTGELITTPVIIPGLRDAYFCYHATQHPEFDKNDRQTLFLTFGRLVTYRLYLHEVVLAAPFYQWLDAEGRATYARAGEAVDGSTKQGVAFYALTAPATGATAIHDWYDATTGIHLYEASSPGPLFNDQGIAFYANSDSEPPSGLEPVYRWERTRTTGEVMYSTFDLSDAGFERGPLAFHAATLANQTFYNPDEGYQYWVRVKGRHDFGCCTGTNNPTRQTDEDSIEFTLRTEPHEDGYEAIVCSPTCGTSGEVVWSGDVKFEPNEKGGKMKLTPDGPD